MNTRPDSLSPALDKNTFLTLCIFLALLTIASALALLGEGTAAANFVAFEGLYLLVVLLQTIFGLFVLPFLLPADADSRARLLKIVIIFCAAAPFALVGAAASASSWYVVLLSQLLVFALWSVALDAKETLGARARTSGLYLPILTLLFFGLLVAGCILEGFSGSAGKVGAFSIPSVVASWSSGHYLGAQAWLGVAVCLVALVFWSKKLLMGERC